MSSCRKTIEQRKPACGNVRKWPVFVRECIIFGKKEKW